MPLSSTIENLHQSNISQSHRSILSVYDFNLSKDDYWVSKVDKLMKDKKKVIQLIKDKNTEIRAANDQNQKLELDLKTKESIIESLRVSEKLRQRQLKQNARLNNNHHFQEVSDIISEEDENKLGRHKQSPISLKPQLRLSPGYQLNSCEKKIQYSLTKLGENLHSLEESPNQLPAIQTPITASLYTNNNILL